jgi:hypothetical protein
MHTLTAVFAIGDVLRYRRLDKKLLFAPLIGI